MAKDTAYSELCSAAIYQGESKIPPWGHEPLQQVFFSISAVRLGPVAKEIMEGS